ncbi:MAG: hypothetical protein M1305_01835 [Candidatus Marsarchaeota archaeon]|nr:hypothetical protein [Candidatus Marsarchaeota archaeon]
MYKVVNCNTREHITILDPRWSNQITSLRAMDRRDDLVCQACEQPVRVKAGQVKRWHFAHKHREDCPYTSESPQLLSARAVLYQMLLETFGDSVTVEKHLAGHHLPRVVDCWVERESGPIAYWIVDARIPSADRYLLKSVFSKMQVRVNWVFIADLLHADPADSSMVHLSTTEREFMGKAFCDIHRLRRGFIEGASLHYMDYDQGQLVSYRGLQLVHGAQTFQGIRKQDLLSEIKIAKRTGEFAHPGEHDLAAGLREEKARQERAEKEAAERRAMLPTAGSIVTSPIRSLPLGNEAKHGEANASTTRAEGVGTAGLDRECGTCVFCGKQTDDWWYFDGSTKSCKCKECYRKGIWR